ncbi:MAG: site-specific integrase (plasmid) [Candidatus Methanoperedens sp.]|nr:MAG: site-specific integrase [Candidatus Methanoperedens sp.]
MYIIPRENIWGMSNPDDIHGFDKGYEAAVRRLKEANISERNRELITSFVKSSKKNGNKKSTYMNDLNIVLRMALFYNKDLDTITENDYDGLIDNLEAKGMVDYNYRKVTKKLFKLVTNNDSPKWVREIHLPHKETPVQPSDLFTKAQLDKLLDACIQPRDKALVAVALDSTMRIGALGTLRIKGIEFNQHGALLYMSPTSQNLKTTKPKPVPLTWSTGFLNQWISVHPCKDDPEAPLWVNLTGKDKHKAMAYNTLRMTLARIAESAGLKKRVFFHLFRHQGVTDMILKGFNDQQIKFQAGWAPDSDRMLRIYGNFRDGDMVKSIYAKHGLRSEEDKPVTLKQCPRCHTVLVPEARMCHQCALVLDAGLEKELNVGQDQAQKALLKMMESPEVRAMLKEMMNK